MGRKARKEKATRNGAVQWAYYVSKALDAELEKYLLENPTMSKAKVLRQAAAEFLAKGKVILPEASQ